MLHSFLGLAQFLLCWLWSFFYDGFWLFSSLLCTIPTLLPLLFILVPQKVVLSLFKLFSRSSLATLLPGFRTQISEFVWNVKLLSLLHFQIVYKFVFAMYLLCSPHTYFKSNNRSIGNQKDSFLALSSVSWLYCSNWDHHWLFWLYFSFLTVSRLSSASSTRTVKRYYVSNFSCS